MGWKQWPSWVKGGAIGAGIGFFVVLLFIIFLSNNYEYLRYLTDNCPLIDDRAYSIGSQMVSCSLLEHLVSKSFIVSVPLNLFVYNLFGVKFLNNSLDFFVNVITYTFLGMLIGWIVGKIKTKKN